MSNKTWEKRLTDEFCVMLERASREGQDDTYWAEKLESFIRSEIQAVVSRIEDKNMIVVAEIEQDVPINKDVAEELTQIKQEYGLEEK